MTPDLDKAFEIANLMTVLSNQKRAIKEEFEQSSMLFYNGGSFKASKELISFVFSLKSIMEENTSTVIIDETGLPIEVELDIFLKDILNCYATASNKYLKEYQKIKTNKSITSILDL